MLNAGDKNNNRVHEPGFLRSDRNQAENSFDGKKADDTDDTVGQRH